MISSGRALKDLRILEIGTVKIVPPTLTSMPSTMARVRGMRSVMQVPFPYSLVMVTVPPMLSTFRFTTSIPTPRPEYSVTSLLVEKPGSIRRERISFWLYSSSGFVRMPFSRAFVRTAGRIDSLSVIFYYNDNLAAGMAGG